MGIIVQLAITWLLAWLFEKKGLGVLGLRPTKTRVLDFLLFLLVTAACATSGFLMRMYFGERWMLNPELDLKLFTAGLWWNIKSILFEELIFRGVILYILIKRLGTAKAILISAIAFGIYHWFTYESWGNSGLMAWIFIITGLMGVVFAFGYSKTFSLYIPCAIHLGWNFTNNFIFSEGQIGKGVFIPMKTPEVTVNYFTYYVVMYLPMASAMLINYWLIWRRKQEDD